jgi:5-formyltetrahydrofolate cyclo-ligase
MEKQQLRKFYMQQFKKFKEIENNHTYDSIKTNFRDFIKDRNIAKIMIYQPLRTELPMTDIVKQFNFEIFYPVIQGENLIPSSASTGQIIPVNEINLIVVPGLFATPDGFRLGRGKGYYDRLLSVFPRSNTVFIGRSWQIIEKIPVDPWDMPVGYYITEDYFRHCI